MSESATPMVRINKPVTLYDLTHDKPPHVDLLSGLRPQCGLMDRLTGKGQDK